MKTPPLISQNEEVISTIEEFIRARRQIEELARKRGQIVCWRGQANHEWPLTSSLVRAISEHLPVTDTVVEAIEEKILNEAASWIAEFETNKRFKNDVSRLIYLQHHGVPTRMIDFTLDPLVALFFSADSHDHADGRVFAVLYPKGGVLSEPPELSEIKALKQKDLRFWQPKNLDEEFPRIRAQKGLLAIGKLPTTAFRQHIIDPLTEKQRYLLAEEIRACCSISVKFYKLAALEAEPPDRMSGKPEHPAQALSLKIHIHKPSIRTRLARKSPGKQIPDLRKEGLSHKVLYPDVSGMQQHCETLQQLRRGVILT